jgi:hypothetical protein
LKSSRSRFPFSPGPAGYAAALPLSHSRSERFRAVLRAALHALRFGASTPIAWLLFGFHGLEPAACHGGFHHRRHPERRIRWNDALGALVAAFPNTGFMGVPLLVALLGPLAAAPVIVGMLVDMVITTSLCIALSRLDGADKHGMAVALKNALRGMLTNPMPWAILLGGLASYVQLELPGPVHNTVGLLADAASPVALFTIGAVLARSQMWPGPASPILAICAGGRSSCCCTRCWCS